MVSMVTLTTLILFVGNISTLLWLRDYEHYYKHGDPLSAIWSFLDFADPEPINKVSHSETGLDFDKLESFLESPFYGHWNMSVVVANTK